MPNSPMTGFTTSDAVRLTGIKKDMLNYLCKMQLVVPTLSRRQGTRGHGLERRYSFSDLVAFKVVKQLAASGVQPFKVRKAIRELHAFGISLHKLPASHVIMLGESAYLWNGRGSPFRVVDGQEAFAFVLDVASIRNELIRDIDERVA